MKHQVFLCLCCVSFFIACVTTLPKLEQIPVSKNAIESTKEICGEKCNFYQKAFTQYQNDDESAAHVKDLIYFAYGEAMNEQQNYQQALLQFKAAYQLADDHKNVRDVYFEHILKTSKQPDVQVNLSEFEGVLSSKHYKKLEKQISTSVVKEEKIKTTDQNYVSFNSLNKDRFYETSIKKNCKRKVRFSDIELIVKEVERSHKKYVEARLLDCRHEHSKASKAYKKFMKSASSTRDLRTLGFIAALHFAKMQRRIGRRNQAATTYKTLMSFVYKGLNPSMFQSRWDMEKKIMNNALWAGRYQVVARNLASAEQFTKYAISAVKKNLRLYKGSKVQRALAEFLVEGYHILAFRIEVERKNYASAIQYAELAVKEKRVTNKWNARNAWLHGFYYHLNKNPKRALQIWRDQSVVISRSPVYHKKLLFWQGKLAYKLGYLDKAKKFQAELNKEFPLSFYSMVDAKNRRFRFSDSHFIQSLGELINKKDSKEKTLEASIVDYRSSDSDFLVHDIRAQYGNIQGASQKLMASVLKDFRYHVRDNYKVSKNPEPFIYIARLMSKNNVADQSIYISSVLSRTHEDFWQNYPKQLFVYFPRPFIDKYKKHSRNIDVQTLLAISHQESRFSPWVESAANAIGLMQVIVPTAKRYLKRGQSYQKISELLREPDTNIKVGSAYIRELKARFRGNLMATVGSYNAGELMMIKWMKRRAHKDHLTQLELVPFGETQGYIRKVLRNYLAYKVLYEKPVTSKKLSYRLNFEHPKI